MSEKAVFREINVLLDLGHRMTPAEQKLTNELRLQVKEKKITVEEAHRIWDKRV